MTEDEGPITDLLPAGGTPWFNCLSCCFPMNDSRSLESQVSFDEKPYVATPATEGTLLTDDELEQDDLTPKNLDYKKQGKLVEQIMEFFFAFILADGRNLS